MTPGEAQLAAMRENAKNSSWRQNLDNAADAQHRFMLPGLDADAVGEAAPEYVRKIETRSEEILRRDEERRAEAQDRENDPSWTRFWR